MASKSLSTFCRQHGAGDKKSTATLTPVWTNRKALFPLWLRVALRGVAWREIETPIVFLFLSPRNATNSRNGNNGLRVPIKVPMASCLFHDGHTHV